MRILYHHRTLADGAEGVHINAMIGAFEQLGHEVHLTSVASPVPGGKTSLPARIRQLLPRPLFEVAATGVNVPEYVQVRQLINSLAPDFVYARHARYDVATLMAAGRAAIPSVLEANSLFTQGAYSGFEGTSWPIMAKRFERRALALATVVVAVSSPLADQIRQFAGRTAHVIPNGADPGLFDPSRADGSRVRKRYKLDERLTIGWSGILREWHGAELLLEMLAHMPGVHLLIVGDGPARKTFEGRADVLGVMDRVTITGRVQHDEMPGHVAAMDVALVADERTGVASPMKMLEYMAMSRAVVAPRMRNIIDIIDDGVDGLLFSPDDPRDMADKARLLARDGDLRRRLGASARSKIVRERNWLAIASQVLAIVGGAGSATPQLHR